MNRALADLRLGSVRDWDSFVRAVHHVNAHQLDSFPDEMNELCAFARVVALESDALEGMLACNPRRSCDALAVFYLLRARWPNDARIEGLVEHARLALEFCVEAVASEQLLSFSYLSALGFDPKPLTWLRNATSGNPWWLLQHHEREPACQEFCDSMVAASLTDGIRDIGAGDTKYIARVWAALLANALAAKRARDVLALMALPRRRLGFSELMPPPLVGSAVPSLPVGRWDSIYVCLADQEICEEGI